MVPNMNKLVVPPASSLHKRLATTPRAARIQRAREDILPKVSMGSRAKNILDGVVGGEGGSKRRRAKPKWHTTIVIYL